MSPDNCLATPAHVDRLIIIDLPERRLRFEPELKDTRPFTASELQSIAASLTGGATLDISFWPPALFDNDTTTTGHDGLDQQIKRALESSPVVVQRLVHKIVISCKQARIVEGIICLEHVNVEVEYGESSHLKIRDLLSAKLHANGDITFPPAATA